ncbi:MAG: response regulator [Candidatus Omnitrophica bacterium]|nr:response regulator [Candidatus Omnitrophota bacterium]
MGNKKVLIVDDDKDFLNELGEVLSFAGYDMVSVDVPLEVMNVLEKDKVDLILLDLNMPGKNGFNLAFDLSNSRHFKNIPIIAMTGFNKIEINSLLELCGVRKCLKKPFRPLDIISEIENMLKGMESEKDKVYDV